jgi:cytochrome d ubiquinol oxidase subunit II
MIGIRASPGRRKELMAFLSSGLYLAGMLTSAAFAMFPNVLIASNGPERSLTIYNAAAGKAGLVNGLYWFIPGVILASGYAVVVYRHFAGRDASGVRVR